MLRERKPWTTFLDTQLVSMCHVDIGNVMLARANGEIQQNESTSDMIFTCAEIIEWLSDNQTLAAGAVIMTGTPEGVAAGRTPPNYLKVGDVLECEVSNIGALRHSVVLAPK